MLCSVLTDRTLVVNEGLGAEETVAVIQVKRDLDTSKEVLAEIARNVCHKVLSKAGLRAVPQRVFVSSS